MKFKEGDKVSFLSEKREGIIKKIINDKMVSVEIEDGFEIPVMADELIKTGEIEFETEKELITETPEINEEPETSEEEEDYESDLFLTLAPLVSEGVYIAYIPQNKDNLLLDDIHIYLLNHTEYDILFTYSIKQNNDLCGIDFDRAKPETKILLGEIERTQLEEWSDIFLQILFFKEGKYEVKMPVVNSSKVNPVKFSKEESYQYCSLIDKKCITVRIYSENKTELPLQNEQIWRKEKIEKPKIKVVGHISDYEKVQPMPSKHIIDKGIAEVDLHIEELVDKTSGLSNGEMLTIQINYFRKTLESAIANNFSKIIFIHGVGDGVLKSEIRKILEDSYPKCNFYDAPMAKYGMGATEVEIKGL
ncbi:MAG: DUF2027 domain-containing protein [Bacteroidales bacterium]|nr:DUF2027 domain-containing protein [Bacteroidales bacterium]